MAASVTIVTACDRNYLWGAYLLAASVARHLPDVTMHLCQTGFTPEDAAYFSGFKNLKLIPLSDENRRNVTNRKAEALLSADTEYIAWLDADCLVVGDVSKMLIPENGEFQIRRRGPAENAHVWRNHYAPGEPRGGLPRSVALEWCKDVGERTAPAVDTTCVANTMVFHRRHRPFVQAWQRQIAKVLSAKDTGVVDKAKPAYFMTDESVLSSLLAFSDDAPPWSDLLLNRDPHAHVAHFGANPKPWKRWRLSVWYCHAHVMSLLSWARAAGHPVPPLPWSLKASNRPFAFLLALLADFPTGARTVARKLLGGR